MKLWVLVYEEHYEKFLALHQQEKTNESFQQYLKEIGTPCFFFQKPTEVLQSNYIHYKEVPQGTCIRRRRSEEYVAIVHKVLYPELRQREDKSRRSSSCAIL